MLETIIRFIIAKLAGVSKDQWSQILDWVIEAEHTIVGGGFKKAWVSEQMTRAWPKIAQFAIDMLLGLACGYSGKRGWISLGDSK